MSKFTTNSNPVQLSLFNFSDLTDRERHIRAAAFMDTDGSIMITRTTGSTLVPRCSMTSITMPLLLWMKENYKGSIQRHFNSKDGYHHRQAFAWSIQGKNALSMLTSIYPFLVVKQQQALYALEFLEIGLRLPTDNENAIALYNKVRTLNGKRSDTNGASS